MTTIRGGPEDDAARAASRHRPGPCVEGVTNLHRPRHFNAAAGRWPAGGHVETRSGAYADGWRDGFTAGAIDALRQAGRELPPETWYPLEKLSERYERAHAGDG
ncbi:MAG TPA: hypothetical protein VLZ05_14940 [Mycobacterium sp.]|nr:hypothetical protein [Mycobacterium sp.]HUH70029.1 hypothetical protein [Mycobacterium sp.]